MNEKQNLFLTLWQECYDASYYALRKSQVWGFLYDTATLEKAIHRQVWDERFGNALVSHAASRFLDDLQLDDLQVSILLRSRMRSFRPKLGVKAGLFKGLLCGEGVLLVLLIVLSRVLQLSLKLKLLKWLVLGGVWLLLLAGAAAIVWMILRSLRAPADMKKAFEEEKNAVLKLLEALR